MNSTWASADVLEIHPHDAETRGIESGDMVGLTSRSGEIVLPADVTDRVRPGRRLHDVPLSGIGRQRRDDRKNSDWATNCPEYKVTAVEIVKVNHPSEWQKALPRVHRAAAAAAERPQGGHARVKIDHLVTMANQIGAFFNSEADKAVAAKSVATHLTRYWDPRMRREIVAHTTRKPAEPGSTRCLALRSPASRE